METGSEIPGLYDLMTGKLIVTGATREDALIRARRAPAEFRIDGVASVLPFQRDFTREDGFSVYTNWIETAFRGAAPAPRVDRVEGPARAQLHRV